MFKKKLLIKAMLIITIFCLVISIGPNISSSPPEKKYQPINNVWLGDDYEHIDEYKSPSSTFSVGAIAISDGRFSAIADKNTEDIYIMDNYHDSDPSIIHTCNPVNQGVITSLSMSENGAYVAAGFDGLNHGWVRMYNRHRFCPLIDFMIPGYNSKVYSVSLQKDGLSRFLAAGTSEGVFCFDRVGFIDYRWWYPTNYPVHTVSVSNSTLLGHVWVAAGDNSGDIFVIDANKIVPIVDWKYSSGACITQVVISNDGSHVVAGNGYGEVLCFNTNNLPGQGQTNPPLWTFNTSACISSISMSYNGDWIVVGTIDSKLYLFNSNYPFPIWTNTLNGPITSTSMSQDGSYISVVADGDNKVFFYSRFQEVPLWSYPVDQDGACIAMSRNGEEIVIGTNDFYYYLQDEYQILTDTTVDSDNGDRNTIPLVLKILHDPNGDGSYSQYEKDVTNKIGFSLEIDSGNKVQYEFDQTLFDAITGNFIKDTSIEGSVSAGLELTYTTTDTFKCSDISDDEEYIGPKYGDSYLIADFKLNYRLNERDIECSVNGPHGMIAAIPVMKFGYSCDNVRVTGENHLADYYRPDQIDYLHSLNIGYDNKIDTWGEKLFVKYNTDMTVDSGNTYTNTEEFGVHMACSANMKISLSQTVEGIFGLVGENYGVSGRKLFNNGVSIGATAAASKDEGEIYLVNVHDNEGADAIDFKLYEDKIFGTQLPITNPSSQTSNPAEYWTNNPDEDTPANSPPYQPVVTLEDSGWNIFYGTASTTDPDQGDTELHYLFDWCNGFRDSDWGDGTSDYQYSEYGNYLVKAKVKDQYNHESIWSEPGSVSISNAYNFQLSTQQITQPTSPSLYTVAVGEPVSYQFYDVQNPEQLIEEWELTYGDGNSERNTEQQGTYAYDEPGLFKMNLSIDEGAYNFSRNITVIPIRADINASTKWTEPNQSILFHDASWNNTPIINWIWNFGDNTTSYEAQVSHSYEEQGDYNVSLTVTDANNASNTCSQVIHIDTAPQIEGLNYPLEIAHAGDEVDICTDIYDLKFNQTECPISSVYVNISYPDGSYGNYPMDYIGNDSNVYSYELGFLNTTMIGVYNCTVWVLDDTFHLINEGFTFMVPGIIFNTPPTPTNNTTVNRNWAYLNTTVQDLHNTSAFIDWDHSLKAYWPMDLSNTTGIYDNSTYENFGIFEGGMNTANVKNGKYGNALEFDGYDDDVNLGANSSLSLGTGDFTFMIWEHSDQTSYTNKAVILTNRPADASAKGYILGVQNKTYLYVTQSSGSNVTLNGNTDVTDHLWHHIAYVRKGTNHSIYVDGAYDAGVTGSIKNITNNQHTYLTYGHMGNFAYFDGLLDEPQIYNRALSREEINASYNNGLYDLYHNFTGLTEGEFSYYAHAIDTSGDMSQTEIRTVNIDFDPQITLVSASPHTVGFGYNVTISANVTDSGSGVKTVNVNVTYPDQTYMNYTMPHTTGNTYQYVFMDSWLIGQYNYTIWATDYSNNSNSCSGHHFHVSAQATISIATLKNSYSGNQYINITDPPNPSENYTLLGRRLTWNTYYDASSGQNILEAYQGPVNYQENNGTWMPINNTISQITSNHPAYVYGYRNGNDHGLYGVYFKSNAQNEWPVAFTYNRSDDPTMHVVRSKLVGVGYVDPQSNWAYQYLQNVQNSQGQTNDYSITYEDVFTGTDVTWSYGNTGLKEEITLSNTTKTMLLNHPPSQYGLNDASSYLVFITKLDHQNLDIYNGSGLLDGNVTFSDTGAEFKDALGQFKCALPLGEAYELNNDSSRQKLTYRIIHLNGNTYLLSGLKVSKLNTMTFPVVVDPTLTVYSISNDGYIYNSGTNYNTVRNATSGTVNSSGVYITIGQRKQSGIPTSTYYVYRGFVFFNTSALPSNAYLDNATLSLYKKDDYSTTDFDITIQNGQPTYPHKPMQSSDYNKNYYSENGGSLNTSRFTSGYNAILLNNLNWINKTGITKLCLRSSRDINAKTPTGSEYVNVHSNEFLGMCPPKLVINYRNQSKIKNTGSTNIKGYLLIQVQFYNSSQGKWMVDNDTINETTPRTINTGSQLGLDTVFNGKIRASNLQHGVGTYRVYTTFRDSEGNILKTNTGVELKAWWQFSKT